MSSIPRQTFTFPEIRTKAHRSLLGAPPILSITNPTFTSKWFEGSNHIQIVELILNNTGTTNWLTEADTLNISVSSSSIMTVLPGTLKRLRPGDSAVVQVGVQNNVGTTSGTTCSGTVQATWGSAYDKTTTTSSNISGSCGVGDYTASASSLAFHSSPDWFNEIKFGIFIHWGVYSAPAYGSIAPNEDYAEWYILSLFLVVRVSPLTT